MDRKLLEVMAMLSTGRVELARPITIHDLFDLEEVVGASSMSVGQAGIDDMTFHHFADGVYIREMRLPQFTFLTGAIHRTAHLSVMCSGDISILSVAGLRRIDTPTAVPTVPGVKRVGFSHLPTVWMDVHPNPDNERDLDKLWDRFYHNNRPKE